MLALLTAAAVLLVVGGLGWSAIRAPAPLTRVDVEQQINDQLERARREARAAPADAAAAYQTILPSLVTVTTNRAGSGQGSIGAGVVVNTAGAILTALHVVEGADQVVVRFADGTQTPATVRVGQSATDTAVLTAQQAPAVTVPAVLAGVPGVGDEVFAVGNPLGLSSSMTAGVVSALDRSVQVGDSRRLDGLIQFDAAVNPGNSGGPLLNRDGRVVGIVTGLANPARQPFFVGVGFAVPIQTAGGAAGSPPQ